ncbi:MAG: DUF58 domain-containing protein, partial [Deferribacterota bacterium]|nr:DUF58 domain-containing protein [Deferribacterota bacterium]
MLLSILLLSGIWGYINIKNLSVDIANISDIYANRWVDVKLKLTNNYSRLTLYLLDIKINESCARVDRIKGGEEVTTYIKLIFKKRGINYIDGVYISTIFPFYFFIRSKYYRCGKKFLVFPEPKKPLYNMWANSNRSKYDNYTKTGNIYINNSLDIGSIREFIEGDQVKDIIWKSFFKTGELLVKTYETSELSPVIIEITNNLDIEKKLSYDT